MTRLKSILLRLAGVLLLSAAILGLRAQSVNTNPVELPSTTVWQNDEDVIGYVPAKYPKRNIILITSNNMRDKISIAHEIAHTLGAEHKDEGLMVKPRQPDHQTYLTQEKINEK